MSRVHISVYIGFDSSIHRNHTDSTYYFRTVGYFRRTKHQLMTEEVHIIVYILQAIVGNGKRACTTEFDTTFFKQLYHRILNYLGIHFKWWDALVTAQRTKYCVRNITYARLQRKECARDDALAQIGSQEIGYILSYLICNRVGFCKAASLIREVDFYHPHYLRRINLYI